MNKKKFLKFLIGVMLLGAFLMMICGANQDSATMDEKAHIPAGFTYLKFKDYRLNPEHPPLAKDIAALPLMFFKLNFPLNSSSWQKDINGQWEVGDLFLYQSGNNADKIIFWARFGLIILTLICALFVYKWAKELLGETWGLLPFFLFLFSPQVLAHGHYVTTDIAATFGLLLCFYFFLKFLEKQTSKNLIFAGIAFGISQLFKFTCAFAIPILFLILLYFVKKYHLGFRGFISVFFGLILIFLIGYFLVYLFYLFHTWNYPISKNYSDARFILRSFAEGEDPHLLTCKKWQGNLLRQSRCIAEIDLLMIKNKYLRPLGHYLLGLLMAFQRSQGGNTGYFMGEVSSSGWRYYFPLVFLIKEPIPSLILIFISLILLIKTLFFKRKPIFDGKNHLPSLHQFSMLSFVILYWAYSIHSPLNIGIRHILPTVPFIYILSAGCLKQWIKPSIKIFPKNLILKAIVIGFREIKFHFKLLLLFILLIWYLAETIYIFPHFIAYFNQFVGGPKNGYKYVVDSNLDWGQDLKRLKNYVEKHKIKKIAVDYFGGGNPKYYLKEKYIPWSSSKGKPKGYFALSLTFLQGAKGKLHPGQKRSPENEYRWLKNPYQPFDRIGYSIFIYKF